jgi:hypothetical protein
VSWRGSAQNDLSHTAADTVRFPAQHPQRRSSAPAARKWVRRPVPLQIGQMRAVVVMVGLLSGALCVGEVTIRFQWSGVNTFL